MLIRYVALVCYVALLGLGAYAWREGDDVEMRLPSMQLMTDSRAAVDQIDSLDRAKRLLGLSLEAHISLQDAMRSQIKTQRRVLIGSVLLGLPALVYVVRVTGRSAKAPGPS